MHKNNNSWADRVMNSIIWGNKEGVPLQYKRKEIDEEESYDEPKETIAEAMDDDSDDVAVAWDDSKNI
jgi:hypothetical protein